jgi:hypothetical protein
MQCACRGQHMTKNAWSEANIIAIGAWLGEGSQEPEKGMGHAHDSVGDSANTRADSNGINLRQNLFNHAMVMPWAAHGEERLVRSQLHCYRRVNG